MKDFENENNKNEKLDSDNEDFFGEEIDEREEYDDFADDNGANYSQNDIDVVESTGVQDGEQPVEPTKAQKMLKELMSWVVCLGVAIVIALVLRNYVFTMVKVDGNSMNPTLNNGERLFTRIIGYTPKRGDIIIFHPAHNPKISYVKRVIAVEGDRVKIDPDGSVWLKKKGNNEWEQLDEDYISCQTVEGIEYQLINDFEEMCVLVDKDHIFVMGDNRSLGGSYDSRKLGQVHVDSVLGKASFRWWPISEFGGLD